MPQLYLKFEVSGKWDLRNRIIADMHCGKLAIRRRWKFLLSAGGHSIQSVHPRLKSPTKGSSLGCWLAPEMTPVAQNCGV